MKRRRSTVAPVAELPLRVISSAQAHAREKEHQARVQAYARPFLERRSRGQKHPVNDFLFTYYSLTPAALGRWHPGLGAVLTGTAATAREEWKFYRPLTPAERAATGINTATGMNEVTGINEASLDKGNPSRGALDALGLLAPPLPEPPLPAPPLPASTVALTVDLSRFRETRASALDSIVNLLAQTEARTPRFGCFGMHEWAMVYRSETNGLRHEYLPLRLGAEDTDRVVEANRISCSHFDAFRFYTPQARPLNVLQPTRQTQPSMEQPGCLHANMDVYKWAYKLTPLLPSELVMDAFELAARVREVDMRASPYDLREWGYRPLKVEEPEGKAEYVREQRGFAAQAQELRRRILAVLRPLVH